MSSPEGKGYRGDPKGRATRSTTKVMLRGLKTVATLRGAQPRQVVSLRGTKGTARRHARKRQSALRRSYLMAARNRSPLRRIAGVIGLFLLVALLVSGCSTTTATLDPTAHYACRHRAPPSGALLPARYFDRVEACTLPPPGSRG